MTNNYINMCYKQAKLNVEWFYLMLGHYPTQEKENTFKIDLKKALETLERACPSIIPTDKIKG